MYLHIGQNTVIPHNEIIGIFDLDITSQAYRTREFLKTSQQRGQVEALGEELPASFILCQRDGNTSVFLSRISSVTLGKRIRDKVFDDGH